MSEKTSTPSSTKTKTSKPRKKRVADKRTGMSADLLSKAFADQLQFTQCKDLESAVPHDLFRAAAFTVRDRLMQRWIATQKAYTEKDVKRVYYLSAEFLMGRLLGNNLLNLGIHEEMKKAYNK